MKNPTTVAKEASVESSPYDTSCVHVEVWCDPKVGRDLIICKVCNETIGIIHYARRDNDGIV